MAIGSSFFFHFLFVHLARLIDMVNEINTAMLVYFERNLSRSNDPKIEKLIIWLYIKSLGCLSGLLLDFLFPKRINPPENPGGDLHVFLSGTPWHICLM